MIAKKDKGADTMKYDLIYSHITSTRAFAVATRMLSDGSTAGISNGIKYLMEHEPQAEQEIVQALERFYNADFGTMFEDEYEQAFMPKTWEDRKAFGEYMIESLDEPIYIHYEPFGMAYDVVIYLRFER